MSKPITSYKLTVYKKEVEKLLKSTGRTKEEWIKNTLKDMKYNLEEALSSERDITETMEIVGRIKML